MHQKVQVKVKLCSDLNQGKPRQERVELSLPHLLIKAQLVEKPCKFKLSRMSCNPMDVNEKNVQTNHNLKHIECMKS